MRPSKAASALAGMKPGNPRDAANHEPDRAKTSNNGDAGRKPATAARRDAWEWNL
jgi:hypothetical protein